MAKSGPTMPCDFAKAAKNPTPPKPSQPIMPPDMGKAANAAQKERK